MINIAAVGDIFLGDHPLYCGLGVRSRVEKYLYSPFEFVSQLLGKFDIVFCNLETVLSDFGMKKKDYQSFQMRGKRDFISYLKEANINVVNLANNHILQHAPGPMKKTIEVLEKNNIYIAGTPEGNRKLIEINGRKVSILGYSFCPEKYFENKNYYIVGKEEEIINDIEKTRKNSDYILVSCHWGQEYVLQPAPWQIELAHKLIDRGADVILGHHPHVLHPIEEYKGKIIAYSLGNFVSEMCQNLTKKSLILKIELSKEKINWTAIPCHINNNHQPIPLKKSLPHGWLPESFKNFSDKEYQKMVLNNIRKFRREFYIFFFRNFYKYPPKYLFGIFKDFLKRIYQRQRI